MGSTAPSYCKQFIIPHYPAAMWGGWWHSCGAVQRLADIFKSRRSATQGGTVSSKNQASPLSSSSNSYQLTSEFYNCTWTMQTTCWLQSRLWTLIQLLQIPRPLWCWETLGRGMKPPRLCSQITWHPVYPWLSTLPRKTNSYTRAFPHTPG